MQSRDEVFILAIIEQALLDACRDTDGIKGYISFRKICKDKLAAIQYIEGKSFEFLCSLIDVSYHMIREKIKNSYGVHELCRRIHLDFPKRFKWLFANIDCRKYCIKGEVCKMRGGDISNKSAVKIFIDSSLIFDGNGNIIRGADSFMKRLWDNFFITIWFEHKEKTIIETISNKENPDKQALKYVCFNSALECSTKELRKKLSCRSLFFTNREKYFIFPHIVITELSYDKLLYDGIFDF